ncbi:MAG: thiamine-phosphate kinase [Vulcanimicrobiaceae bacterium]
MRPGPQPRRIVLGIGDDAAAWRPSRSHLSVISSDALVDGVHFRTRAMSGGEIGHRAMAANLSDVAAMGARPVLATVALGIPAAGDAPLVVEAYRAMAALAARHGARIVGGDIVGAPVLFLSLTVVGEVSPSRLARRDGGRPGDVLAVTGPLGASRAGLALLERDAPVGEALARRAAEAFARPEPRVAEGRWLAASRNVRAMVDLSDGLSTDLGRLARASGCGAELLGVPIDPAAEAVARALGDDPLEYALDGGEDFELLVAVARRAFGHLAECFRAHFRKPLLGIGTLIAGSGVRLLGAGGTSRLLEPGGFEHLR